MLPKFKLAARGQLQFFCGLNNENVSRKLFRYYNHIPTIWRCACEFKVLLKFKTGPVDELHNFFVGAKPKILEVRNTSFFTITLPTIWECADDLTEIKKTSKSTFAIFVTAKTF